MKKKIVLLLIALLLVSTSLFATVFQFGPVAALPLPMDFDNPENMAEPFKHFDNYRFGADLRLSIPTKYVGVQFDVLGLLSFGDGIFRLETIPTVDLVLLSQMPVNLTAGIGYDLNWAFGDNAAVNGQPVSSILDSLKNSPFVYRVGLNIDAKVFGLGISYYMPTTASIADAALANWKPNLSDGRISVSVFLLNF